MIVRIKKKLILVVVLTMIMILFACFSYGMVDYSQYQISYERIQNNDMSGYQMEIGYIIAEKIGVLFGLNFEFFRGIYLFIAILLLVNSIWEYSANKSANVLMVYMLYPFLLDIVQIRHFMASAIVIFSLRFLKEKNKRNIFLFFVLLGLAASQHLMVVIYASLLIIVFDISLKKYYKMLTIVAVVEVFILLFLSNGVGIKMYNAIIAVVIRIRGEGSYALNFSESIYKHLAMMLITWALLTFILYSKSSVLLISEEQKDFIWLYKISLMSLLYIPFVYINSNFARVFRGMMPILYIMLFIYASNYKKTTIRNIIYKLVPFSLAGLNFYMFLSKRSQNHWENVTVPILQNNYFIELLFK